MNGLAFYAGPGELCKDTIRLYTSKQDSKWNIESGIIYQEGIIIGDPLCNFRMFEYGDPELIEISVLLKQAGVNVIYQTPLYVTERNISLVQQQIRFMYDRAEVKVYLVQDIGLLNWIKTQFSDVYLIWSRMGFGRGALINEPFVHFLRDIGIHGLETNRIELLRVLPQMGIDPWPVCRYRTWKSVCRECYSRYMDDRFSGDCDRLCRNPNKRMKLISIPLGERRLDTNSPDRPDGSSFSMNIDGHFLGESFVYTDNIAFIKAAIELERPVLFYGKNMEEIIDYERKFVQHSISDTL